MVFGTLFVLIVFGCFEKISGLIVVGAIGVSEENDRRVYGRTALGARP